MALVECIECKGMVSTSAASCPHCGRPVDQAQLNKSTSRQNSAPEGQKSFWRQDISVGRGCLILLVLFLILPCFGALIDKDDKPVTTMSAPVDDSHPDQSASLLVATPMSKDQQQREYLERVKREADSMKNFRVDQYLTSKDTLVLVVALFGAWVQIIDEGKNYDLSSEEAKEVAKLKSLVARTQVQAFPKIRDKFGPAMRDQLWEHNISARTIGKGYKVAEFTGVLFASNANIKEWQGQVQELMIALRFNQIRYKWYDGADEYTYIDLKSPPDSALVVLLDGGGYRILE